MLLLVSVATHPTSMPSTRDGILGWNIEKYSTPMERSDWSILCAYVINIYSGTYNGIHVYICIYVCLCHVMSLLMYVIGQKVGIKKCG